MVAVAHRFFCGLVAVASGVDQAEPHRQSVAERASAHKRSEADVANQYASKYISEYVPKEYQHVDTDASNETQTQLTNHYKSDYIPKEYQHFLKQNSTYSALMLAENATTNVSEHLSSNATEVTPAEQKQAEQKQAERKQQQQMEDHYRSKYEPKEYQHINENTSDAELDNHFKSKYMSEYVPREYQHFENDTSNESQAEVAKQYQSEYVPKEYQHLINASNESQADMAKKYQAEYVPKEYQHFIGEEKNEHNEGSKVENSTSQTVAESEDEGRIQNSTGTKEVDSASNSSAVQLATSPVSGARINIVPIVLVGLSVAAAFVLARQRAAKKEVSVHLDEPQSQFHLLA